MYPGSKKRIALVGMPVIPDSEESLFNGFLRYANEHKSWEYVFSSEGTADSIRFLRRVKCDGALVRLLTPEMALLAKKEAIPMVNVSTWLANPQIPTVCRDDIGIGRCAAEHLIERGFRRFACVTCPGGWYAQARSDSFRRTVESHGFQCATHSIKAHFRQIARPQQMTEVDLRRLEEWLQTLQAPTGLFWTEDHLGQQLLSSCQRVGLNVPRDIAVVSSPNRRFVCEACDPPLSSVDSSEEEIGYIAAQWLERLMAGDKMTQSPQTVSPSGVVARKSSDTFASDDPDIARALQYIYDHLRTGINASEVVNALNLSRRTFYRTFQLATGQPPQSFIQNRRVQGCLDLLTFNRKLSLQEVAVSCGFRDRNRMNIAILKATGKSPQEWRSEKKLE